MNCTALSGAQASDTMERLARHATRREFTFGRYRAGRCAVITRATRAATPGMRPRGSAGLGIGVDTSAR